MILPSDLKHINYILDLEQQEMDDSYVTEVAKRGMKVYKATQGFFKPFDDGKDFLAELLTIIRHPLAYSLGAVVAAFNTVLSACYFAGALVSALGLTLFISRETGGKAFNEAGMALIETGTALLGTCTALLLIMLSIPNNVASFLSRTAATLITPLQCCQHESTEFLPYI